jgi:hypothetical protein
MLLISLPLYQIRPKNRTGLETAKTKTDRFKLVSHAPSKTPASAQSTARQSNTIKSHFAHDRLWPKRVAIYQKALQTPHKCQPQQNTTQKYDAKDYDSCEDISGSTSQPCAKKMRAFFVLLSFAIE